MATLTNGTALNGSFNVSKKSGTVLTLATDDKFVDKNIQFTIGVISGAAAAGSAAADADVESTDSSSIGGVNISGVIGTKQTSEPSTGYYIRVKATGSGSSKVTTAGWIDAGNLNTASTTATKYFPVAAAGITVAGGGLTNTSDYVGTPTVDVSLDSQTTTGVTITDTKQTSGYYVKLTGTSSALSGTTTVTRAAVTDTRTAGYLPARSSTSIVGSTTSSPTVTVNKGSKEKYLVIPPGSVTQNAPAIANSTGIVTATSTVTEGYVETGTKTNTLQLTTKAAATYNTSTSDQSIAANRWLTGAQTIKAVTTANIDAENIRTGVNVKVGDANNAGRIKNVTGTFTSADTVSEGQTAAASAQMLAGYSAWADGEEVKGSITSKAATTYNASTSDQTIAAGQYLAGAQTIRKITTGNISAANIKTGVTVTVGDSGSSTRIANVAGTFTKANTVSSGQTAAAAAQIRSGYSAWVDGVEVKGSLANTSVSQGITTVSDGTATRGTASWGTGYISSGSIGAATFANSATSGKTYVDISDTTAAPVLISEGYLYINKGYTDDLKISLAKLVPDGASADLGSNVILSGYSAYNNDGVLIAGTIPTKTSSDMTVSGKTVTAPAGYYASAQSKNVADGAFSADSSASSNSTVTPSVGLDSAATSSYGFTTTKPSGTTGTNFLTIDPGASATAWSVTPRANVTTSGYIAAASKTGTAVSQTPSVAAGTNYYVPIVNPSFSGGGLSGSTTTSISVTGMSTSTSATDYYIDAAATGTISRAKATYTNSAGVIASHSGTQAIAAGSIDAGSSASRVYIPAAGVSVSGGGLSNTSNYSGTPTVSIALSAQTTSGAAITDTKPTSGYYLTLGAESSALSGTTTVTRAAVNDTRTAGYLPARSATAVISAETSSPTVTVNKGSKTRYVTIPSGAITNDTTLPSGSSSSGTVSRGKYIKIGAGYYGSDSYYIAQANSGTKAITGSGTTSVDGYANVSVAAAVGAANTASASIAAASTDSTSISLVTTKPSSGNYYTLTASGSGSSKITTEGWIGTGALAAASTTAAYYVVKASSSTSNGTATATNGTASTSVTGMVTTTTNTGYSVSASATGGNASVTASSVTVGAGYNPSSVTASTTAKSATGTSASDTKYIQKGVLSASVSSNTGGSASMAATGFTASSSATSYYVTLSTTAGSVKAKAAVGTEGYVKSETNETSATSVAVSGNGNKLYIPAGAYSASVSSHSISTTPVVTGSIAGTVTNIGTTTKPSGTDGTNYWTITPSGSVTTTGVSSAKGKATIGTAGYVAAGNSETSAHTVNITPTVNSGSARYIVKGTITNNTSGGTYSGTINMGSQIKIGAGYYTGDTYYQAAAPSGNIQLTQASSTNVSAYATATVRGVTAAISGGGLSGTATASGTNASISDSTNNSGVSIKTACTASRAAVNCTASTAGWASGTIGTLAAGTGAMTAKTYYVNGVTLTKPSSGNRTFTVTVPEGSSTRTITITVSSAGVVTYDNLPTITDAQINALF